ncbi:putative uncharacterized protein [Clostridium sp. CAG:567]|jgi:hypothetical protein ELI_2571|nr:putative uncharacterized protein [Clostridium sp. CAG:567]
MEIGSEFWLEDKNKIEYESEFIKSENLFLSGRTAIDYALQIIENIKKIEKVYFPSYCCESMLLPFQERNIKIEFYAVTEENRRIEIRY